METIIISADEMKLVFSGILSRMGFPGAKAEQCADVFTANSIDGVYTHGVNRFPRFVDYIKKGYVRIDAEPVALGGFGTIEQWNGNLGAGILNAIKATDRAMQLARQGGIGLVGVANTNHWMRGGYYGWQAAKQGYVFIGWSNTVANMPAWNALDSRLGNNPLVFALPYEGEAIVLDMAMSQFSFGTLEQAAMRKEELPVIGGFDSEGKESKNPQSIIESKRVMPIGYWKGAGLSLLLDLLAAILSGGLGTHQVSKLESEYALSQVFICIDLRKLPNHSSMASILHNIIQDYKESKPDVNKRISYPGEGVLRRRKKNGETGIPVLKKVWQEIQQL